MKTPILLALASTLLAGATVELSSCASQPPRGTPTNTYIGNQSGTQEQRVGDPELAKKFVLLNVNTDRQEGRLRRVQFDLKNTTQGDLAVEWWIEWKDASGFTIDTNPHWTPLMVAGMAFQSIQVVPPTPEAAMFQLQLRRPSPVN